MRRAAGWAPREALPSMVSTRVEAQCKDMQQWVQVQRDGWERERAKGARRMQAAEEAVAAKRAATEEADAQRRHVSELEIQERLQKAAQIEERQAHALAAAQTFQVRATGG